MDQNVIERELYIDATPAVVFEVVSRPEHVRQWWPDEAEYELTPGAPGRIRFGSPDDGTWVQLTVVEAAPPQRFAFRWTQEEGQPAVTGNSMLVVFELEPSGDGTRLRMTESGFDERHTDEAARDAELAEHVSGWDHFLPRLRTYVEGLAAGGAS